MSAQTTTRPAGFSHFDFESITIQPKLKGMPLLRLLRYAYGLRDLNLFPEASYATVPEALTDLLVAQLVAEARELIARGLTRRYLRTEEELGNPRGQIDLQRLARRGPLVDASLPCVHYPRSHDFLAP